MCCFGSLIKTAEPPLLLKFNFLRLVNSVMESSFFLLAMQDFRYMATSDLTELLRKSEWRRDDDTEKRLCELILAQLDDSSGDVSSLAVKWCAVLHDTCMHVSCRDDGFHTRWCWYLISCDDDPAAWACWCARSTKTKQKGYWTSCARTSSQARRNRIGRLPA